MPRKRLFLILLSIAFPSLLLAQVGDKAASTTPYPGKSALTFGSQIVLDGCWSETELKGTFLEKKTLPRKPAPARPQQMPASCKNTLPPLPTHLQNSIRSVIPADGRKLIALTFDLCEGQGEIAGYDADIVDFLRTNKIKATFFAGGKWMKSHPERTMQLIADPLFEIGNHSWNHPNFRLLSEAAMQEQIMRTQAQYEILWENLAARVQAKDLPSSEMNKIPRLPFTFRFPYGTCTPQALHLTAGLGLPAIQWSIVTADPVKSQTAERIARTILNRVKPGAIIIMHANGKGIHTARALSLCVPQLQHQGYQLVMVSELFQAGPVFSTATCYQEKPDDNEHYDRINRKK
jgi:peptidoglycan-N-acetylglucosamine deacetylase